MNNFVLTGTLNGFFSVFRGTVGTLSLLDKLEDPNIFVYWNQTLYNDKTGENAWEYYFEQIGIYKKQMSFVPHNILPREYSTRVEMNRLINKYVKVKQPIQDKVNTLVKKLGPKPLGVHIRMTDKNKCEEHGEPISGRPTALEIYIKHINKYLNHNPDSKIYLATDDYNVLATIRDKYEEKVVFSECIRSEGKTSIHHDLLGNNRLKGEQVLVDCMTLSKCNHLIKGISNVALCAMFWNLDLTSENMNSIYNNDYREDFVCKL